MSAAVPEPARIRFYGCRQPCAEVLPKLLGQAARQGMRAVVRSPEWDRIRALDEALWAVGEGSFLPHGTQKDGGDSSQQPIYLSTGTEVPNGAQLLILMDGADASDEKDFQRVFYLYEADDEGSLGQALSFGESFGGANGVQWVRQGESGKWESPAAIAPEAARPKEAGAAAPAPAGTAGDAPAEEAGAGEGKPEAAPVEAASAAQGNGAAAPDPDPGGKAAAPEGASERTLSIIKPDATAANVTGRINARLEEGGLRIVAQKRILLTRGQAEAFYAEHSERPFFQGLCDFMTSGPVVVQVLEGPDAIKRNRALMGATNPEEAEEGTIRRDHGSSIERNSVHGSDSPESAAREISFLFAGCEVVG